MLKFFAFGSVELYGRDQASIEAVLSGPKRVGLLAYLALARPRGFHRRDTILPLLWPEADQRHARGALRNLLHQIRRAVGPGVLVGRGSEEIGLVRNRLWCDVLAFEEALAKGRPREALKLYRGDLLEGFHLRGAASEFQHWLENERDRQRRSAAEAAWALAKEAETGKRPREAVAWGRWAASLFPWDEAVLLRLVRLLERAGEPSTAVQVCEEFAARWGEEPGGELRAVMETNRARELDAVPPRIEAPGWSGEVTSRRAGDSSPLPAAPDPDGAGLRRMLRGRWRTHKIRVGLLAFGLGLAALLSIRMPPGPPPVVAIGQIQVLGAIDTTRLVPAIRSLLTARLTRAGEMQVISRERLARQLAGEGSADGQEAERWSRAARRAGAEILIHGVLQTAPDGGYRLSLARYNLFNERFETAATARETDLYSLVDRAIERLLSDLSRSGPGDESGAENSARHAS